MANFYGHARTNYFNVKDEEAFLKALENVPDIEIVRQNIAPHGKEVPEGFDFGGYGILVSQGDSGCFPSFGYDDDIGDDFEFDLVAMVSEHLADGQVAVFMEVGAEKMRYVSGWAEAVNNKGERKFLSLTNIYEMAQDLTDGTPITPAEY